MIDDPETPTTNRPTSEQPETVQFDDFGQRQEGQENIRGADDQYAKARVAQYDYQKQQFQRENPGVEVWSGEFFETWERYLHNHFPVKDASIINAIFSVESFDEYIEIIKKRIMAKKGFSEEQVSSDKDIKEALYKEVSETIEKEIVLKMSELYIDVDKRAPDETFEEIVQANFMESVRLSYEVIGKRLQNLGRSLKNLSKSGELPKNIKEMLFYKKVSVEEQREINRTTEKGLESSSYSTRPYPMPKKELTSVGDFIEYVSTQTEHYMNLRRYLHNAMVIFRRGKGEHGFYAQLAEYAKQMSNSDIDSMMRLPDSDLFMAAHNLYIKHLTMFFAKHDWIHQPGTFSAEYFDINTEIEQQVMQDLKRLYPDIQKEEDWRLLRALKLGVGISRAVTLSEVEIAAYADPAVQTGKTPKEVTYESFYIGDSSALTAFRPTYNMERFMPPDLTNGPLFFSQVAGFEREKYWNHNKLWERMNDWQKSYIEGKRYAKKSDDEVLMIDAMQNFGKVGSIEYRSGWRYLRGYEAWLKEYGKSGKFNYLESWKQIENIGYTILRNFSDFYLFHESDGKAFLKGGDRAGERDAFFKYLNDKYINFNPITGEVSRSLDAEIASIKAKNPKISEEDLYKLLINKALFGVLRNRIPSLFIRLDRTRMSEDGVRAYEEIRRNINKTDTWDDIRMDRTLRNLSDVEMKLRLRVSAQMREYLNNNPKGVKDLADPSIRYVMTEEFIRNNLSEMIDETQGKEQQIEDTVSLFKYINKKYLIETEFADGKIKMLKDGKYPYTLALEEFDRSFVAYRGSGDTPLYRALNDTASIEQKVSEAMTEYSKLLREVAIDPKRDLSPLIKILSQMREQLSVLHGDPTAWERTSQLVGLTINYFKKDFMGKAFYGLFGVGRRNSLAAEYLGGTSRGVWEWDNPEIDRFIVECERHRIIPRDQKELKFPPEVVEIKNKLLNFLGFKNKLVHKIDPKIMTGKKARELFGATKADIIKGYLWKYLPIVLAVLLWASMNKAFKKEILGKD